MARPLLRGHEPEEDGIDGGGVVERKDVGMHLGRDVGEGKGVGARDEVAPTSEDKVAQGRRQRRSLVVGLRLVSI